MAIPETIKKLANDIRTKIYGREVREALAQGIEEAGDIADQAYQITQNLLDDSFDQGLLNTEIEQRMEALYNTKGQMMDDLYEEKKQELESLYENEKAELDNLQEDYANRAQTLETTYAPRLTYAEQKIEEHDEQLATVETQFANEIGILNEQLVQLGQQVEQSVSYLQTNKADIMYVDTKVQGVSLAYKESFATLTDLQTAYPSGDVHNHVVLSDGMIYTWANGKWTNTQIQANGTGIANKTITPEKTTFFLEGSNKLNVNDPNYIEGKYIQPDGALWNHANYITTGYILVPHGKKIALYAINTNGIRTYLNNIRTFAVFDLSYRVISNEGSSNFASYYSNTISNGDKYVRLSFNVALRDVEIVVVDANADLSTLPYMTEYHPFGYKLAEVFIPKIKTSTLDNDKGFITLDEVPERFVNDICLPSKLYMLNGALNHIFVEPIIKRWRPYNDFVRFSGTIPFTRRYSRMMCSKYPEQGNTLITTLVNSDDFKTIKEITSTINVGNKGVGTGNIYAQIIGDSFTHGAFFKDALLDKGYVPNLKLVGLRKVAGYTDQYDEGRGGWSLNDYFTVPTGATTPYHGFMQPNGNFRYWGATGFWKNAHAVKNGTLTDWTYTYNCGRYDDYLNKFDPTTGFLVSPSEGDIMYDTANSTYKVYTGGTWVNTTYSTYSWGIDYAKYLSMWGIAAPSTLFVMLGLNDFRNNYENPDFTKWNNQITTFKESYLSAVPNGKFVICIPCSTCGSMDNTAGEFTIKQNAAMWNFRKNLIDTFDNRESESIYLVDVGATIDNEYGYETSTQDWDTLPYDGYTGTERLRVQVNNPHPTRNYPIMGVPLAAFLQHHRTDV